MDKQIYSFKIWPYKYESLSWLSSLYKAFDFCIWCYNIVW